MKHSTIYRKAAEAIDSFKEDFSCTAITRAESKTFPHHFVTPARKAYCKLFEIGTGNLASGGPNLRDLWSEVAGEENKKKRQRVYMLLLAAEIAESEGN